MNSNFPVSFLCYCCGINKYRQFMSVFKLKATSDNKTLIVRQICILCSLTSPLPIV